MDLIVVSIVGLAALSVGRRAYRLVAATRRKSDASCGGGCCGK